MAKTTTRGLNAILSEVDAGKKPEVNQADLLAELNTKIEALAGDTKVPAAGTFSSPEGEIDFKYATVNDKLAMAIVAVSGALVTARANMQEMVSVSAATYTEDAKDAMIDAEATAILIANARLRNLGAESKSSLF